MDSVTLRTHDLAIFTFISPLGTLPIYVHWFSVLFIFSHSLFPHLKIVQSAKM